jgi:hypothetical protein
VYQGSASVLSLGSVVGYYRYSVVTGPTPSLALVTMTDVDVDGDDKMAVRDMALSGAGRSLANITWRALALPRRQAGARMGSRNEAEAGGGREGGRTYERGARAPQHTHKRLGRTDSYSNPVGPSAWRAAIVSAVAIANP